MVKMSHPLLQEIDMDSDVEQMRSPVKKRAKRASPESVRRTTRSTSAAGRRESKQEDVDSDLEDDPDFDPQEEVARKKPRAGGVQKQLPTAPMIAPVENLYAKLRKSRPATQEPSLLEGLEALQHATAIEDIQKESMPSGVEQEPLCTPEPNLMCEEELAPSGGNSPVANVQIITWGTNSMSDTLCPDEIQEEEKSEDREQGLDVEEQEQEQENRVLQMAQREYVDRLAFPSDDNEVEFFDEIDKYSCPALPPLVSEQQQTVLTASQLANMRTMFYHVQEQQQLQQQHIPPQYHPMYSPMFVTLIIKNNTTLDSDQNAGPGLDSTPITTVYHPVHHGNYQLKDIESTLGKPVW